MYELCDSILIMIYYVGHDRFGPCVSCVQCQKNWLQIIHFLQDSEYWMHFFRKLINNIINEHAHPQYV